MKRHRGGFEVNWMELETDWVQEPVARLLGAGERARGGIPGKNMVRAVPLEAKKTQA